MRLNNSVGSRLTAIPSAPATASTYYNILFVSKYYQYYSLTQIAAGGISYTAWSQHKQPTLNSADTCSGTYRKCSADADTTETTHNGWSVLPQRHHWPI
jgi:hypothetical protein